MLPINKAVIAVLLMCLVTYLPRMIPITLFKKQIESTYIKSFLNYVPYAVLASLTFPDVFTSTRFIASAIVGTIFALYLAWKEHSLVTVAIGAIVVVYVTELFL